VITCDGRSALPSLAAYSDVSEHVEPLIRSKALRLYEDLFLACSECPDRFPFNIAMGLHDLYVSIFRALAETASDPGESSELGKLLADLRSQRNLWLLLHIMDNADCEARRTVSQKRMSPMCTRRERPAAIDQLSRQISIDGSGFLPNPLETLPMVTSCRRVLEWLERTSALDLDSSMGAHYAALAELGSLWDPSYRWGLSLTNGTAFDMDAPFRGDLRLADEDLEADERICRACFGLLRCGRLEHALELLRRTGQHWRAALFQGGHSAALEAADGSEGSHWILWRKMARDISKLDVQNFWERSILCLLSGGAVPVSLLDAPSMEDRLWVRLWSLLDEFIGSRLAILLRASTNQSTYLESQMPSSITSSEETIFSTASDIPNESLFKAIKESGTRADSSRAAQLFAILPLIVDPSTRSQEEILRTLLKNARDTSESPSDFLDDSSDEGIVSDLSHFSLCIATHLHWYLTASKSDGCCSETHLLGDLLLCAFIQRLREFSGKCESFLDLLARYTLAISAKELRIRAVIRLLWNSPIAEIRDIISAVDEVSRSNEEAEIFADIVLEFWSFAWTHVREQLRSGVGSVDEKDLHRLEYCLDLLKELGDNFASVHASSLMQVIREFYSKDQISATKSMIRRERESGHPNIRLQEDAEWQCWCALLETEDLYLQWTDYMFDRGPTRRPRRPQSDDISELESYEISLREWLKGVDDLALQALHSCLNLLQAIAYLIHDRNLESSSSDLSFCVRIWCSNLLSNVYEISQNPTACRVLPRRADVFVDLMSFIPPETLRLLTQRLGHAWTVVRTRKELSMYDQ